ncbi:MAG: Blue (Type 1) copper domain protein [Berkelbacteria bacterium GW2011_GWB1_38_5]|uniref:Blue (Type 1) copper domain protein n=1 Tax=Berkelbacteria bacterium GW2011_GWB1_38_5 TaxID=1618336 RepID=A0A0G0KDP9_9BACT|nr:MAG: Blue (Type 1) copper domain protein [Berkelbacteria bacterium GW2011_GWB1_38_5]
MKNIWIILAVIVVIGLLAWIYVKGYGKGGNQTSSPTPTAQETVNGNSIKISNLTFSPVVLEVTKGTKVIWTNDDPTDHTVTADNGEFSSSILAKGKTFEFTFNDIGEFSYHCSIHTTMKAKIVVKWD